MAFSVLTGSPAQVVAGDSFEVKTNNLATVILHGSPGANAIALEQTGDGTNWVAATDGYGVALELSATNKTIAIFRPGKYRVNKTGASTQAVTVYVATNLDP
jgi:hypothetical protein